MAAIEVKVPDIGDFKDVPIIEILVKSGDAVTAEQPLLTLESDKATLEVPAPAAGVIGKIVAKIGDKVSMGSPLLMLEATVGATVAAPPTEAKAEAAPPTTSAPAPAAPAPAAESVRSAAARPSTLAVDFSGVFAGPAARRLARELDIDLTTIQGTGDKGRITVADIKIAARGGGGATGAALPDVPTVDFAKFGPIETVPLSRIKRISGPRLHASWVNVPHVTHCDDADVTELEAFRKSLDDAAKADKAAPYRVSLLPLLMKASVATLKAFPTFNSALSPAKDSLIYRRYWHIGVAVDTPDLHHFFPRRHRRHGVHADRQCAGGGDPRRRALAHGAGLGRQSVPAAADAAALPVLRPSRHRWRGGGALHAPSLRHRGGHAARPALAATRVKVTVRLGERVHGG